MGLSTGNMRRASAAFWTLFAAVWFTLGSDLSRGLKPWDEGIYFSAAQNALRGRWLIPKLSDGARQPLGAMDPFLHKPPLAYWIQAVAMAIGGETPMVARIPSLIAMSAVVGLTVLLASRLSRPATGLFAGLAAMGIPAFTMTRGATSVATDPFLLLFGIGAMYCLVLFVQTQQDRWAWIAGFAYGAAILTKYVAAAPFGLFVIGYLYRYRDRFGWDDLARMIGGGLLTAAPWFLVAASLEFDALLEQMIMNQAIGRATGASFSDSVGLLPYMRFPYFRWAPIYFGWPFAWLSLAAIVTAARKRFFGEITDVDVVMWPFAIGVILLYAMAGGNHIWYVMPAAVPIAILVADAITTSITPVLENLDIGDQESKNRG